MFLEYNNKQTGGTQTQKAVCWWESEKTTKEKSMDFWVMQSFASMRRNLRRGNVKIGSTCTCTTLVILNCIPYRGLSTTSAALPFHLGIYFDFILKGILLLHFNSPGSSFSLLMTDFK